MVLVHVTRLLSLRGWDGFELETWTRPDFVFVSGVPGVFLALMLLVAFTLGRRGRHRASALWMAWAVFVFGLLVSIPQGVHAVGWSVQPLIILLVTCTFGVWPGLVQATSAVVALVASAWLSVEGYFVDAPVPDGVWTVTGVDGAVIFAMALCGALLYRTLHIAISAEEDQLHRIDQAKRALRHRENLLRHAMRVETVGEMSSMIVHQLRNQFQLVLGHTAMGTRASEGVARDQFRHISETVKKSNELLESLLGMARTEGGEVRSVDLTQICTHLAENYGRVLPAAIELILETPDSPVWVLLDPQGLEHAILNLVLNARQAMAEAGEIRLRLSVEEGHARVEVQDTGVGISESHFDDIFRPFFTTKEKGKGTGLGLAAVQRFAKSSNGSVEVTSAVGVGTTFCLVFPLTERSDSQAG